jgi:hypothetical protein
MQSLYREERPADLTSEEEILADLIKHDRSENSGLQSFIRRFIDILEFDAHRKGRRITQDELTWYAETLGRSVTDAIQYFIGNGRPVPSGENQYLAANGAHITHMLRDMTDDVSEGYVNVPREYLQAHGIQPHDFDNPILQAWVRERVELAREYFRKGKRYLDELDLLRTKLAGYWFCLRFEIILDAIDNNGYRLCSGYGGRSLFTTLTKMALSTMPITARHLFRKIDRSLNRGEPPSQAEGASMLAQSASGIADSRLAVVGDTRSLGYPAIIEESDLQEKNANSHHMGQG